MTPSNLQSLVEGQLNRTVEAFTRTRADASLLRTVVHAGETIATAMQGGNKLMVAGNGGSAADAQHIVAEFVSRLTRDRPALPAIALTTDTSILTAIGNDFSFDNVFERQIDALGRPGDVFLGISTSGNARNITKALQLCRDRGIKTIGYLGSDGGIAAGLCDHAVIVPSRVTMHIQEVHLALEHILCLVVERIRFGEAFDNLPQYLAE